MPNEGTEEAKVWTGLEVLWDESAALHSESNGPSAALIEDPSRSRELPLWERIHGLPGDGRTALCLSGGGIRSAAFNLGVVQTLARLGLLERFNFLSTVSGGGYIGCWLSAWRFHARQGLADVIAGLSWPDRSGGTNPPLPPSQLPAALEALRQGTSYLTPRTGPMSPDTWTAVVLSVRNLLLNYLVLVPLFIALLFVPKLMLAIARESPSILPHVAVQDALDLRADLAVFSGSHRWGMGSRGSTQAVLVP